MKAILFLCSLFCFMHQATAAKSFQTMHWQTANGAKVVFYQAMEVPMLTINVAFAAGSAYDAESYGLSALTTRLLNQGNQGQNATVIAEKLDDTGAQFQTVSNQDMVELDFKTLVTPSALNPAIALFASLMSHPDFPLNSFTREKNQQLMAIAQAEESPDEVANQMFFKILYQKHPYAHPIQGTRESVNALTLEQVKHFYQQYFVGRNAIIVLVGAIDQTTAHQIAEQLSHDLPPGKPAGEISKASPLTEEMDIGVKYPSSQTVIRLGQLGIDHHNKDYFPYIVGNYSLGGGTLVSRLSTEVRGKRGLTYGIYSEFAPMPGLGPFLIGLSTQNAQAATALDVTRQTLTAFIKTGPDESELAAAKKYLTGSFPLSLASSSSIANLLLKIAFYHLPEDYLDTYLSHINSVTAPQIKQAFQQLVTPNKLLQVSVGKM